MWNGAMGEEEAAGALDSPASQVPTPSRAPAPVPRADAQLGERGLFLHLCCFPLRMKILRF